MRSYIFTDWEREKINEFLNHGTIPNGLPTIKTRIFQNLEKITEDIKLGFEFWSTLQNEASTELRDIALDSHIWFLEHFRETSSNIPSIIVYDVQQELISKKHDISSRPRERLLWHSDPESRQRDNPCQQGNDRDSWKK